jgi:hypothetical protein
MSEVSNLSQEQFDIPSHPAMLTVRKLQVSGICYRVPVNFNQHHTTAIVVAVCSNLSMRARNITSADLPYHLVVCVHGDSQ